MRRALLVSAVAAAGFTAAGPADARAQDTRPATDRLNVFFACAGPRCDPDPYKARIRWVNWVDGPDHADVRVSMTSQPVPGGGLSFVMDFAVSDPARGAPDRLLFRSAGSDSDEDVLNGIATTIAIGFARYSVIAGLREFVVLRDARRRGFEPGERVVSPRAVDDPWDLWVFTVGGNAHAGGSDTRKTRNLSFSLSAARVAPTWTLSFSGSGTVNAQKIEFTDGSAFESDERSFSFNTTITYALARHWSVNLSSLVGRYPMYNQRLHAGLNPGIEYSIFPYEEATRRSLTLRYTIGLAHRDYVERTIYGEGNESLWEQAGQVRATMRQPWGDLFATGAGSHFLADIEKYSLSLSGGVSFRIVRGLRLNASGEISRVKDEVYLSARGITDEQALLRLRQLQSIANKRLNFGLSYQFGSIYNNTVNNRFPGVGEGG